MVGDVDDDNVSGVIGLGSRLKWVEEVEAVNMIYEVSKLSYLPGAEFLSIFLRATMIPSRHITQFSMETFSFHS